MQKRLKPYLAILLLLAASKLVTNFLRAKAYGDYRRCRSNLNSINLACELYYCEHNKQYPQKLTDLTPTYLKKLPECPVSSHSASQYGYRLNAEVFTIYCQGDNHLLLSGRENWPLSGTYIGCMLEH